MQKDEYEELKKQKTLEIARNSALRTAGTGGSIVLAGTLYASKYNQSFSKYMSVSAKTSLPVMTALFLFGLQYELKLYDVLRHPKKYGVDGSSIQKTVVKPSSMPFHHQAMNYFHDHPFVLISSVSFPFVGSVLYQQMQIKHLTISQRILASRVIGQAGVLVIALSVIGFRDYMDKHGRFPDPNAANEAH
jgi:hypothetical protein